VAVPRVASEDPTRQDRHVDDLIGWTLMAGLLLSIGVMALGLLDIAIRNSKNASQVLALDEILPHLFRGDAPAVLDLGILLLFATPLFAVLMAWVSFIRQRDATFVVISTLLLVLLAAGFFVALH